MARLHHDLAIVQRYWRDVSVFCDVKTREITYAGTLRLIEEETRQPTEISLRGVLSAQYPHREPKAFVVGNRFEAKPGASMADRHINWDRSFCLWLEPLSRWDPANPDALAAWLDRVAVFCEDQLVYDATGIFPHGEWAHGDAAYAELLLEGLGSRGDVLDRFASLGTGRLPDRNNACFCGSGIKYKKCHKNAVDATRQRIGEEFVARGIVAWLTQRG